jgi:hypothetical protein
MVNNFIPSPNPLAVELPHVVRPRLLIQYIHSCPPYVEAVSSIRYPKTRHGVLTATKHGEGNK